MSHKSSEIAEEIKQYEREVEDGLRRFYNRKPQWGPCHDRTPAEQAMEHEERPGEAEGMPLQEVIQPVDDDLQEWATRCETVRRMYEYFTADGPHPAQILRRVYALGAHMAIPPFSEMTVRERAQMLGDSHGAQHWRMQRICVDPLRQRGAHSISAPGQKGSEAAASASAAQRGNANRRCKHLWRPAPDGSGNQLCRKCGQKKKRAALRRPYYPSEKAA